ncbi:transposase [Escherichia coli]|uniref:hypothetical protein n=2 Tax=Escherichia coli TaxID=562 RepID=UPI0010B18993|nr:hypothetical protein [Escherichia coli]GCG53834.1 transposase [Escherichia coli]
MDISLLSTTRDPEQLRALAIAMVQKAMAESQNLANVVQEKDRNIAELQNRIRILENVMNASQLFEYEAGVGRKSVEPRRFPAS